MIKNLLAWYERHARVLPWRGSNDTYEIWLSEIILQQTRIEQGTPYYHAILQAYPTVHDMAAAEEDELYSLWQGLGYYNRCRNMLKSAKYVSQELGGVFPTDYEGLLNLAGVGPYTAAAIASIRHGEARLALDGNLRRVLSRVYGIAYEVSSKEAQREFEYVETVIFGEEDPGEVNQALMDLGSQVCKPKNPFCMDCPLNQECFAFNNNKTSEIPFKAKKVKRKQIFMHYLVPRKGDKIWISKRSQNGIWQNLYEFHKVHDDEQPYPGESEFEVQHELTHRRLNISFATTQTAPEAVDDGLWVNTDSLSDYAMPVPLANWWSEYGMTDIRCEDEV